MRKRRVGALYSGVIVVFWLIEGSAMAETLTVCSSTCDYRSVQSAINAAAEGDIIQLATAEVITESGIVVDRDVTIQGDEIGKTIQAAPDGEEVTERVFTILGGVTATLRRMTIRNGRAAGTFEGGGGGIYVGPSVDGSLVTLERVMVEDCEAQDGGGIYNDGTLVMAYAGVVNSMASDNGGGIYNSAGGRIIGRYPNDGGAPAGIFANVNVAGEKGGGIFNEGALSTNVDTVVNFNEALTGAGIWNSGVAVLSDATLQDNAAGFETAGTVCGAGIWSDGQLYLIDSSILGHSRNYFGPQVRGAGLCAAGGDVVIQRSAFRQNSARHGGALYIAGARVDMRNSSVTNNEADGNGGGAFLASGALDISYSTFDNNTARWRGGGIYVNTGEIVLANATITWNVANLAENTFGEGGGVYLSDDGDSLARITSSIIGGNAVLAPAEYPDCFGPFASGSRSLIHRTGPPEHRCTVRGITAGMVYGTPAGLDDVVVAPVGQGYMRHYPLRSDSPAVDSGHCEDVASLHQYVDQVGNAQPVDGDGEGTKACDMGAAEYGSALLVDPPIFKDRFGDDPA